MGLTFALLPVDGEGGVCADDMRVSARLTARLSRQGIECLAALESLNLYYNRISSLAEVFRLHSLAGLSEVDLRLNPVAKSESDFRLFVVRMLPGLQQLGRPAALQPRSAPRSCSWGDRAAGLSGEGSWFPPLTGKPPGKVAGSHFLRPRVPAGLAGVQVWAGLALQLLSSSAVYFLTRPPGRCPRLSRTAGFSLVLPAPGAWEQEVLCCSGPGGQRERAGGPRGRASWQVQLPLWPGKNRISQACGTSYQGANQPCPVRSAVLREAGALTRYPGALELLCCEHCGPGAAGRPGCAPRPASEEGGRCSGSRGCASRRPWGRRASGLGPVPPVEVPLEGS